MRPEIRREEASSSCPPSNPTPPSPSLSLPLFTLSLSFHPQRPTNPSRPPTLRQQAVLNWERRHQRPLVVEDGHRQQEIVVVHLRGGGWEPGEGAHTCQHLCKGWWWRRNKLLSTCGAEQRAIPCSRRTEAGPCCGGPLFIARPTCRSPPPCAQCTHSFGQPSVCGAPLHYKAHHMNPRVRDHPQTTASLPTSATSLPATMTGALSLGSCKGGGREAALTNIASGAGRTCKHPQAV